MTYLYGHLFVAEPEIGAMFPAAMDSQRHRLCGALYRIVVTRDGQLDDYLGELGRAHRKFGVRKEHYAAFRTALLAAANRFTPQGPAAGDAAAGTAWLADFDRAAELMVAAAAATAPGARRGIVLYHGARTEAGLYDLPALRRLELEYPWLEIHPATSEDEAEGIAHGTIPILGAKAAWDDSDVYISGPDAMIAKTASALRALGADPAQLHYDLPDENLPDEN